VGLIGHLNLIHPRLAQVMGRRDRLHSSASSRRRASRPQRASAAATPYA
jgi:hypothetical protein